jgi:hypothetical protein
MSYNPRKQRRIRRRQCVYEMPILAASVTNDIGALDSGHGWISELGQNHVAGIKF